MAKFYGPIGYAVSTEKSPGVWKDVITEHNHYGDVIKDNGRWQSSDKLNDDLSVNNVISIVADPFANSNFYSMRYIKWMGTLWNITNVEVRRPRLILTLGGVYNGPKAPVT
jgi:hypothetical protein